MRSLIGHLRAQLVIVSLLLPALASIGVLICSAQEIQTSDIKATRKLHIEGGEVSSQRRFDYVLSVVRSDGTYLCAASLIAPGLALTASHCVSKAAGGTVNPDVTLSRSGLQQLFGYERFQTRSVVGELKDVIWQVHPLYVAGQFDYDVALLFLSDVTTAVPVKLASPAEQALNGTLRVLGWGATEANTLSAVLRDADIAQLPLQTCVDLFAQFGSMVTRRMLCMTGKTCAGDSGGPLVQVGGNSEQDTLFGQVSFGFPRAKGRGCPNPNPATVFTDLAAPRLNLWIRQAMQLHDSASSQPASTLQQASSDLAENAVSVDYP